MATINESVKLKRCSTERWRAAYSRWRHLRDHARTRLLQKLPLSTPSMSQYIGEPYVVYCTLYSA